MDITTIDKRNDYFLEKRYLREKRLTTYIALEEMNFTWSDKQVEEFDQLWNEGHSLEDIAAYFERDINETAILLMDRSIKGKVFPRKNGIFQNLNEVDYRHC